MAETRLCSVESCCKPHYGRGWCAKHYQRWAKYGSPDSLFTKSRKICSVPDCGRLAKGYGYCMSHLERLRKTGSVGAETPLRKRGVTGPFITSVATAPYSDECIVWPYAKDKFGRGFGQYRGKHMLASRAVCIEAHGEPPTLKHEAAHSCGNGHLGCVNPHHLRWATRLENEADKLIHGTRPTGERMSNHVLTDADCDEIRRLRGTLSQRKIAVMFGVSQQHICAVQLGRFRKPPPSTPSNG